MAESYRFPGPHGDKRPTDPEGKLLTGKQVRARARRRVAKADRLNHEAEEILMVKPIDEWDIEELAHGRPRAADGTFRGRNSRYISRELHEEATRRLREMVRGEMNVQGLSALATLDWLLNNSERDRRGKLLVQPSVRLQAATFLIDHIMGKAVQPQTTDISVTLQGILATTSVSPVEIEGSFVSDHQGSLALPGELVIDEDDIEEVSGD
jgi:hypothetical protein